MLHNTGTSHDHRDRREAPEPTSWGRAIVVSGVTVALLVLAFFYVPQWILTLPGGLARGSRVWLATGWTALAFVGACYSAWWYTGPPPDPATGPLPPSAPPPDGARTGDAS